MFDLVIRDALLVDGSGAEPRHGDLAVSGGRIAELGRVSGAAREVFEAGGLALMPGIIDNHTHYDAQITWDPGVRPSPQLGVTTAVIGNCGFTIAPCRSGDRELVMRNLTQVEGMSLEVLRQGIRWDFETLPQYLDMLERQGSAVNIAVFAGHSALRTYVMGADATRRPATEAEVAAMRHLLLEALRAGAVGFSTSTSPAHNGEGGLPMPSRLADEREMRALVGALGEARRGVFMLTKGGHTPIPFLEDLAADSGRPVVVAALFYNSTNPEACFKDLNAIYEACQRGRRMVGAVSCTPLSMDFTMKAPYVFEGLTAWQPALPLKGEQFRQKLRSRELRDAIRAEVSQPARFRLFNGQWDQVEVVQSRQPDYENRTIAALARASGKDPLDFMFDLALNEDLDTLFNAMLLNWEDEGVGRMLRHPASLVSLSDAGAHLTFFNDAGFGLHLLGHWVRRRRVLTLAEAVRRLTRDPATVFGIRGRGELKPGFHADLLLFDPARVDRGPKQRVYDLPGGHPRLSTPPIGVEAVWVNGVRLEEEVRPGQLLREFSA